METFLVPILHFLDDLIYKHPKFTNSCIRSVVKQIQKKIVIMQSTVDECKKCRNCSGRGYINITYKNHTCPVDFETSNFIVQVFYNGSIKLANFESLWQLYRDDFTHNFNHLNKKMAILIGLFTDYIIPLNAIILFILKVF